MADISITAGNVLLVTGTPEYGTAGATITAGMPLYKDSAASNKLKAGKADAASTDEVVGIALHGASDGQPLAYAGAGCVVNMGATLALGKVYMLSAATAGGVAPVDDIATGNYVTVLGVAITTANLKLNPIVSSVAAAGDVA